MSNFKKSLEYVLINEGGYVDRANDKGGPTHSGITLDTFSRWAGRPASIADIQCITPDTTAQIYRDLFWVPMGLDSVPNDSMATALFDMGVNRGPQKCMEYAQLTLHKLGAASLESVDPEAFTRLFAGLIRNGYNLIVQKHPDQKEFLQGWLARADRLLTLLPS